MAFLPTELLRLSNTGALNGSSPDAVTFGASSTGYLDLNGNNVTVNGLSTSDNSGSQVVQDASAASGTLTVSQPGTATTYAGVLKDGTSAGSLGTLGLTLSSGTLNLAGANTYTGATTVNGGVLNIYGSLGSSSVVTVNSGATLSGTGGTVGGAVTVQSGGTIAVGTAAATGTLALGNGMTLSGSGIAAFNLTSGGANDQINITGNLNLGNGAILQVTPGILTSGTLTYVLMTYTGLTYTGATPLANVTEESLLGQSLPSNYQFTANSGTLELTITPPTLAYPAIVIATPTSGSRVMGNTSVAVSGTVTNFGPVILNGTLSGTAGHLTVSNLSPSPTATGTNGGTTAITGTITSTGLILGNNTFGVTVTDGNASPTSATATGTLDVLQNRVVTATSTNFGLVHLNSALSSNITLSSPGTDNQNTRVTVADSSAPDASGLSVTGGSPSGTFNGSFTDTRSIGGTISTLGVLSGSISLTTGAEGLAGESPINVGVLYSGTVFSGTAAWNVNSSGSWATNGNWVDTQQAGSIPGAPGLSGAASIGDTATFGAVSGLGTTPTVSLNGVSPTLAGITFSSATNSYTIATGTGTGSITLQGAATPISVTGSDTISANLAGNGLNKTGSGTLALSGSNTYTGSTQISSGVLQLTGSSLPTTTVVTLGDNSNDSGQLVLGTTGAAQSITIAGLQNLGNGTSSVVGGGNSSISTLTITAAAGSYTYGGVLGGAGSNQNNLTVSITGTLSQTFTGTSTYTGIMVTGTSNNGGILGIGANETFTSGTILTGGAIGTGTLEMNNSGTLTAVGGARFIDNIILNTNGGTVTVVGSNAMTFNQTAGYFAPANGNGKITNNDSGGLTLAGPVYLNITTSNASMLNISGSYNTTISGSVGANPTNSGTGKGLQVQSSAELILTNPNSTYNGVTQVTSGTLVIEAIDSGSGTVTNGAIGRSTLQFDGGTVMAGPSAETVDNSGSINNSSTIGGGSNLTFTGAIVGLAGKNLTIVGPGNTTFTNTETYSGSTIIASGNLVDNGSISGPVSVSGSGGTPTLSGTGVVVGGVTTSATSAAHIAPGANTSDNFGVSGTLSLNTGLSLGAGTNLDFDLGTPSNADLIAVTGTLSLGSNIVLNVNTLSGFALTTPSTYNLISYTGALTGTTTGWSVSDEPVSTTATFAVGSGDVTVTFAPTAAPGNSYWSGAQGSGGNGTWNSITSGSATNWLTARSGGVDTNQVPYGGTTNVFFIADSGSNTNTYLGFNASINSLNFTGTDATVTTGSAVTISGSIPASGTNNTLTINATGTNGNTAGSGLTMAPGSGAVTISAPVALGGNQTWSLNASPSSPLVISGTLSGAHALAVSGSGKLVLGGNNTFTGGLTINNNVDVILNNVGALNSSAPDAVAFGASSTGTLNLNGNSVAIGTLSTNATPGAPVIQNGTSAAANLTVNQGTNATYAGAIQNGTGGGSLSLTMAGPATLTLTGAATYTGSTTVTGGNLQVDTSLSGGGNVTINGGALGGVGTIAGAVAVNSSGTITSTAGTGNSPGTLTLTNGLVINSGGAAAFNLVNAGANDLINVTTGGVNLNSGAILEVAPNLTVGGTYALMTYTGADPSLAGIVEVDYTSSGTTALQFNYSLTDTLNSGTLDLIVTSSPLAVAGINLTSPVSGSRVMSGTSLAVSGSVTNTGTSNTLSGTLANAGLSLTVGNLNPAVATVGASGAVAFSGTIASTGVTLGNQTYGVTVTDGSSINNSATASGTVDVVTNRVITASGVPTYGAVHEGTVVSSTFTLSSAGADNQYTRVTVADAGADPFGISITGGNPSGTFNGSFTDTRVISGTFSSTGTDGGITLVTTGEGIAGESPINVPLNFGAAVFSGHASWGGLGGNSSWSTNTNWGDTNISSLGTIGAPGLSGALSVGDTALFADFAGESPATTVSLNGANPTLAGLTFSSTATSYTIAQGSGGSITLQNGATIGVTSGTATIGVGVITSANALTVTVAPGSDLIWSGSEAFTGSANITSGTLTLANPTWLGQTAGTNVYNINSGAVLQLNTPAGINLETTTQSGTIEGSGTLQITGGALYIAYFNGTGESIAMNQGGVIEVASGASLVNGGNGATGGIIWTNNNGSLQVDAGGTFNTWNTGGSSTVSVDALSGAGTVTRIGYGQGANFVVIGVAGGSGTFSGTITNGLGTVDVTKQGAGIEVFTGSNGYAGPTAITGGTLRITTNSGLGFGGPTEVNQNAEPGTGTQHSTAISGGSVLDVYNGITLNNAITLNGGSLVNSGTGTSILDSGIAGITFTNDPNVSGGGVTVNITGGGGSGATASGGQYTPFGTFGGIYLNGAGNNNSTLYVQMTNAGSGYTPFTAPTVTITDGFSTNTGTVSAVVSSLVLIGQNNYLGGAGNLTVNAQISGSGGFSTVGTGTVTLANAETYTGATTLGAGTTLQLGTGFSSVSAIGGSGAVIVAGSGTDVLAGVNTYTGSTTISSSSTLQLGNGVNDGAITNSSGVLVNGALVFDTKGFQNLPAIITGSGGITMIGTGNQVISGSNSYTGATVVNLGTLQLGSTTALGNTPSITISGSGSLNVSNGVTPQTTTLSISGQTLTLANGASLEFGVSNSAADQLVITNGASLTLNGTIYINPILLSGTGISTPQVIITDASGFQGSGSFALGPLPLLASATLTQTGTTVTLTFTGVSTVYWAGSGTLNPGSWSDYSNFTTDPAGTVPLTGSFGPIQDVVFSGSTAINQNNSAVDYNATAHSLTINDPAGVLLGDFSQTLTLSGFVGNTGINVTSAATGMNEIATAVDLAGTPNITVDSTAGLLISGAISGSNGIIVNGAGMLTLTGVNTYTGGTQLISGTLNVSADASFGASGSGNGVTFNPGAGNSVTLQASGLTTAGNRTFTFATGTGILDPGTAGNVMTIAGPIAGTAVMDVVDTGEVRLSGSVAFNGTALVSSGTLALTFPGTLAQTGTVTFNTAPGATLLLSANPSQNISPAAGDSVTFTGNGTLRVDGANGTLQMHGNTGVNGTAVYPAVGGIYMDMTGGTMEIANTGGTFQNGGLGATVAMPGNGVNGSGTPLWSGTLGDGITPFTNVAAMQIDSGASVDVWDGNTVTVDALLGSGTLTRTGYSNNEVSSVVVMGDNNGSGQFDGVITNAVGSVSITKTGTGTEILTGNNSYSGSTLVTGGGTLKVTSNTGLGFGGQVYNTGTNEANGSVTVTGSSTLDINGGITVDKAVTLNGGSLINSAVATTSILDNGIAAVKLAGTQSGSYATPTLSATSPGTGSGATFAAGSTTDHSGAVGVYGAVATAGSGYTVAPGLAYTDSSGTGTGVTATAVLSSLTLAGNSNFLGGDGNLTINAAISGTSGFTEVGAGTLTFTGSVTYTGNTTISDGNLVNQGVYNIAAGNQLRIWDSSSGVSNSGTMNLSGAVVTGTASGLANNSGGSIVGYGTIESPFSNNAGATVSLTGGGLAITQAFTNAGTIQLSSLSANLTGGAITNNAMIQGFGSIGSDIANSGTIAPNGGTLILNGSVSNTSAGLISTGSGSEVLVNSGLATNSGTIGLAGGIFDNGGNAMNNAGQISGYGTLRVGTGANGLTNNGSIAFTSGSTTVNGDITNAAGKVISVSFYPATFTGNIINNGTFETTSAIVSFTGTFSNNGAYLSDPSVQNFASLAIGVNGSLVGGAGDVYKVTGNVTNNSTQAGAFNISGAKLTLAGTVNHQFTWSGADLGSTAAGYENNFAIGTLELQAGGSLTIEGESGTGAAGVGIYASVLQLDGGLAQIASITGNGADIYYDPTQAGNAYLGDQTYALQGGGEITAAIPEPGTVSLLTLGMIVGMGLLGRRKKH